MPYIKSGRRIWTRPGANDIATTPGELNFQITELLIAYMEHHGLSYSTCNDIIGACEGAKLEFYRRVATPYEESKIAENGDVYS